MLLREWLTESNKPIAAFAKELRVERVMIYRYFAGTIPRVATLRRIEALTGGKVTVTDFYYGASS